MPTRTTRTRTVSVLLLFFITLGLWTATRGQGSEFVGVAMSIPDTCAAPGDTLLVPVFVGDVTDSVVLGAQLKVVFDSTFVQILDVGTGGTIAEAWQLCAWNVVEGQDTLRIATAGTTPLEGKGRLLGIAVRLLYTLPADSACEFMILEPLLNEGTPAVRASGGTLTVPCSPAANQ